MNGKNDYQDDQRVIANMNVEGMPWYHKGRKDNPSKQVFVGGSEEIKGKELFRLMSHAVLVGLAVAMVFIVAFFLFILFALNVWFN